MAQVTVTIVGLGQIGASFGLALKAISKKPDAQHTFTVIGSDRDSASMDAAMKLGAVDRTERNLENAVSKADVVLTATPYKLTKDIFEGIGAMLKPGAVVIDTSPAKLPPIAWAKKYFRRNSDKELEAYLVGVTPIINPEHLGEYGDDTQSARASLFDKGLLIIAPDASCPGEAVQLVADLANLMGIRPHFTDPAEHDSNVAGMEGLPLLVQLAMFRSLNKSVSWDDLRWFGNSSFFLSTYKLAQGDAESYGALAHNNREALARRIDSLIEILQEIRGLMMTTDEVTAAEMFQESMTRYERWLHSRNSHDWNPEPKVNAITTGGLMGGLLGPLNPLKKKDKDTK